MITFYDNDGGRDYEQYNYCLTSNFEKDDVFLFNELCYRSHSYGHKDSYLVLQLEEQEEILAKARKLKNFNCLFVPAWLPLNRTIKEEIRIAKRLGVYVRFISHGNLEDNSNTILFAKLRLYSSVPGSESALY